MYNDFTDSQQVLLYCLNVCSVSPLSHPFYLRIWFWKHSVSDIFLAVFFRFWTLRHRYYQYYIAVVSTSSVQMVNCFCPLLDHALDFQQQTDFLGLFINIFSRPFPHKHKLTLLLYVWLNFKLIINLKPSDWWHKWHKLSNSQRILQTDITVQL